MNIKIYKTMKKLILTLMVGILLTSCNTQRNLKSNEVTHILAINERGDTVQVPMSELRREFRNEYQPNQYNNWQFYWGSNWYWGNVWYPYYFIPHQYSYRYHYWDNWYWRRNPVIINQPRRVQPPRPAQPPRQVQTPRREVAPPRTNPTRVTPVQPRRYTPSTPPQQITPQQQRTNPPRVTPTQPKVTPQQQRTNPPKVTPNKSVNPPNGSNIRKRPTN
jgi:hypothetical protein